MIRPLAIFGAGGFGKEVLQLLQDIAAATPQDCWEPIAFVVDAHHARDQSIHGLPVRTADWLASRNDLGVIVAVGSSAGRARIVHALNLGGPREYPTLLHPRAWVGNTVQIGAGAIICAGAMITTDIRIGSHAQVHVGCTVGHDAVLDDFVTLTPGVRVAGHVRLGQGADVGTGAVLIPHSHVGEWSIIGAGTVVTKPLAANVTAVGSPARIIRTRPSGWQKVDAT